LLRYLLDDDKLQSKKAAALIRGASPVLITDVVLSEAIWTLKGKKYKLDKEAVIRVVNALFEEPNICFEDGQSVWKALGDFRRADPVKVRGKKKQADFSDALIVNKAKFQSLKTQEIFRACTRLMWRHSKYQGRGNHRRTANVSRFSASFATIIRTSRSGSLRKKPASNSR